MMILAFDSNGMSLYLRISFSFFIKGVSNHSFFGDFVLFCFGCGLHFDSLLDHSVGSYFCLFIKVMQFIKTLHLQCYIPLLILFCIFIENPASISTLLPICFLTITQGFSQTLNSLTCVLLNILHSILSISDQFILETWLMPIYSDSQLCAPFL